MPRKYYKSGEDCVLVKGKELESLKNEIEHLRGVIDRLITHRDSHCSLFGPDGYLRAPEVDKIVAYNEIEKIVNKTKG